MTELSAVIKEAVARSDNATLAIVLVELTHSLFPGGALRFAQHDADISISGYTYAGIGIEGALPGIGTEPSTEATLRIDSVSEAYQYYLSLANDRAEPVGMVLYEIVYNVLTEQIIGITRTINSNLKRAQYDLASVTLTGGTSEPPNIKIPIMYYTPATHPALYR